MELKEKVAFVSGSTRGIGKAIAVLLCHKGARVILNSSKSNKEGREIEKELKSKGLDAIYFNGDISNKNDLSRIFNFIKRKHGRLDILVNCAGSYLKEDLTLSEDYKVYEKFHKVNGWGTYLCSVLASKLMKKGKIVNISSIYGVKADSNSIIASGVKSEVESYTKSFAKKFKGRIEVNSVAPGYTKTKLLKDNIPFVVLENSQKILLEPEQIAKAAIFLIENDGISGQTIVVDNGHCLN